MYTHRATPLCIIYLDVNIFYQCCLQANVAIAFYSFVLTNENLTYAIASLNGVQCCMLTV